MRKALLILFLFIPVVINAKNYYVATPANGGNDSNAGTISSPFATWGKLTSVLVAGDIAYIRGGTYRVSASGSSATRVTWVDLHGTSGSPIQILAYPGESPILNSDDITITASACYELYINSCTYLTVKGLRVTGGSQSTSGNNIAGLYINNSSNCTMDQVEVDHIGGYGFSAENSSYITYKNCDAHHCMDPYSANGAYENANGFNVTGQTNTSTHITYDGCRAWKCSDDGFDFLLSNGVITLNNCQSFWNGYDDSFKGLNDGNGYKLGPLQSNQSTTLMHTLTNCLAAGNRGTGFDENGGYSATCIHAFYNNVSYHNELGWNFQEAGVANIFKNNISYANHNTWLGISPNAVQSNNSWNSGVTVSASDFLSTDDTELGRPRKADGSLPDINFLRPVAGSRLIDAGVNVGIPFSGSAPDLGAFEIQNGITAPVPAPVFVSAVIENATQSILGMTYDLNLNNLIVPATSSFNVLVNSVARTVNSVAISATKVQLTLASAVKQGDIISVSYTKPANNPIQTSAGGTAASITTKPVTNNCASIVLPVYASSVIENATPSLVEMTYNLTLANIAPAVSAFNIQVNSVARSVNSVAISGNKVQLTLASAIKFGDIVTVTYTKPANNPLQIASGAQAEGITSQLIVNKLVSVVTDPAAAKIKMTIYPNPVHHIINMSFEYTAFSATDAAKSPQLIRIYDIAGKLFIEKLVETGVVKIKFPINLRPGIYVVITLSGGLPMASQKIIVY